MATGIAGLLVGCSKSIDQPYMAEDQTIHIQQDSTLQNSHKGTKFIVHPNVTFNMNDKKISGQVKGGVCITVEAMPNSIILNPNITTARRGISLITDDLKALHSALRQSPSEIRDFLSHRIATGRQIIKGGNIEKARVATYVEMGIVGSELHEVNFSDNRVSVYLEAYSSDNLIKQCKFIDGSKSWANDVFGLFGGKREDISLDATANNVITGCYHKDGYLAHNMYNNCGEGGLSRISPCMDNRIEFNTIKNYPLGTHIASRLTDRRTECNQYDIGDGVFDTILKSNIYKNCGRDYIDNGIRTVIT